MLERAAPPQRGTGVSAVGRVSVVGPTGVRQSERGRSDVEQPATGAPGAILPMPRSAEDIPGVFDSLRRRRETQPILHEAGEPSMWHVFGYDDVVAVLSDHARFSSRYPAIECSLLSETVVAKDPPDHRKLRSLVNLAFTPRAVARLSARIADITQELLDAVRARGEMDVVADLAHPLPARVIAELLGMPRDDRDIFQRWMALDAAAQTGRDGFMTSVREEVTAYFSARLEERRRQPRGDLMTALSEAVIDGERLTEYELVTFCFLLLFAGQETTKNLIANFVLLLSDHVEAQDALVRQPALVPGAAEEALRYLPPVWNLVRRTTTEVELSGVRVPAGELVMPWMASANRDPRQFPEPDRFDYRREPNRHLSFGQGVHFCIGAPLTRLEASVALPMMLEQLPHLRVVRRDPIAVRAFPVFTIPRLPVTFTAG
jgi:cytochrome P450